MATPFPTEDDGLGSGYWDAITGGTPGVDEAMYQWMGRLGVAMNENVIRNDLTDNTIDASNLRITGDPTDTLNDGYFDNDAHTSDCWDNSSQVKHIVVIGDSITEYPPLTVAEGGLGGTCVAWPERLMRRWSSTLRRINGAGFYGLWRARSASTGNAGWSKGTNWVRVNDNNAQNLAPWGETWSNLGLGTPSSEYLKFFIPSTSIPAQVLPFGSQWTSSQLYFVDGTLLGNWQYSLDSGSTWTNVGTTLTAQGGSLTNPSTPVIKSITINVVPTHGVWIRPYTGSVAAIPAIVGIQPIYTLDNGVVIHNMANAGDTLSNFVGRYLSGGIPTQRAAANPYALIDALPTPTLVIMEWAANDVDLGPDAHDLDQFETNLRNAIDHFQDQDIPVMLMTGPDMDRDFVGLDGTPEELVELRGIVESVAVDLGCSSFNLERVWGDIDTSIAAGYQRSSDKLHPTEVGMQDIARRMEAILMRRH